MARIELTILGNITNLTRNLNSAGRSVDRFASDAETSLSKLNAAIGGIATGIAAAFTVDKIIGFAKSVLDATGEAQKLSAVLTNSLGSSSLAASNMAMLADFAAKTPFGINELTSSFVKLVNQGFTPTIEQIRSLGDLASSTGKSFDQLTEAIIDAQVGEYERLKEFGIRASDQGDKVLFTFKGVQTQVEKTSSAIREYITNLGNAEGVSGSMAVISATLTGQISNLQDSYDQMLISIGNNTSGAFSTAIAWVDSLINRIKDLNNEIEISNKYGISGDFWQKVNRAINPFSDKGLTGSEKSVIAIQAAAKATNEFVRETNKAAKSSEDFDKAIKDLQKTADSFLTSGRPAQEIQGMRDQYYKGVQTLLDLQKKFIENANKPADGNFGKSKSTAVQDAVDVNKLLAKLQQEAILLSLTGADKEVAASNFKYDELRRQADQYYKEGKLKAEDYYNYIARLQGARVGAAGTILQNAGAIKSVPINDPNPSKGLGQVVPVDVTKPIVNQITTDPTWDAFVDDLDKQLSRSVQSFGRDFMKTLSTINQQADTTFSGIVGGLITSFSGGLNEVLNTTLLKGLEDVFSKAFKDMGQGLTTAVAGVGLAGTAISGITKRTSTGGQALGGALSGAAAGASFGGIYGAAIGAVVGTIGGILSSSSARKQEQLQADQLKEQERTNALLERQNALSYASSIIGQQTTAGIVTGIIRDAFGNLSATVQGDALQFVLLRSGGQR